MQARSEAMSTSGQRSKATPANEQLGHGVPLPVGAPLHTVETEAGKVPGLPPAVSEAGQHREVRTVVPDGASPPPNTSDWRRGEE